MDMIAQIIGLIAMAANVASFQFKSKRNIILCQLAGSTLFAVNLFMLGAITGALLNVIGIARALVYMDTNRIPFSIKAVTGSFISLYAISYALVFTVFGKEPTLVNFAVELLPIIGMTVTTVSFAMKDAKAIRMLGFINSPCWLAYNVVNFAIGGILGESIALISITSAMIRIDLKKGKSNTDAS